MKVVDPGHTYELLELDDDIEEESVKLVFVKRTGDRYPGNEPPPYHGTILQEILRASADRLRYVISQGELLGFQEDESKAALSNLVDSIWLLEARAARVHNKPIPTREEAEKGEVCWKCGHVVCSDTCDGQLTSGQRATP